MSKEHTPQAQARQPQMEGHKFHEWSAGGVCHDCGCTFAGLDRVDPCPGHNRPALSTPSHPMKEED